MGFNFCVRSSPLRGDKGRRLHTHTHTKTTVAEYHIIRVSYSKDSVETTCQHSKQLQKWWAGIGTTFSPKTWIKRESGQGQEERGVVPHHLQFKSKFTCSFLASPSPTLTYNQKHPLLSNWPNTSGGFGKSLVHFIFVARGKLASFKTMYHEWKVRYQTLAATSFPLVFSLGTVQILRLCKG